MKKGAKPVLEHDPPCKKQGYRNKDANRIINQAHTPNRVHYKRSKKIPQRTYFCLTCHTWHLTSKRIDTPELEPHE